MSVPRRAGSDRRFPRPALRSLLVAALVAAAGTVVVTVSAAPAQAVQTDEFGLRPAGDTPRAKIEVPASGATSTDAVVVYNRTNTNLTVTLGLVGVESPQAGQYAIGDQPSTVSARLTLPTTTIDLGPGQQANVPITIVSPRGTTAAQWAAVVATAGDVDSGALSVRQRLAVLVGFTPTAALVPLSGGLGWWWLLIVLIVLAVTGGLWYWRRRRRQAQVTELGQGGHGGRHGASRHAAPARPAGHRRAAGGRRPSPVPVAQGNLAHGMSAHPGP